MQSFLHQTKEKLLKILLPRNNQPERNYIVSLIFREYLGLDINIQYGTTQYSIEIKLANGKELLFEDHLFNIFPHPLSYLEKKNVPQKTIFINNDGNSFISEPNLPLLFGRDLLDVGADKIICGIDIVASIFFMLTRWEEYANPARDQYNRFPGSASIAVKNNFIHRPIVNEYVEMLWNMLKYLGINQKRKKRKFKALITHDVDLPLLWKSPFSFIKKIGGDLIKRNSLKDTAYSLKSYTNYIRDKSKDPYDTFDELMDLSETCGLKSHFFFLCGGQHKEDNGLPPSHPFIKNLLKKINDRGHIIGFHPSFDSFNNEDIFNRELNDLKKISPQPIKYGRQHFLRFEAPNTWRLWENAGMEWESSMYYPDAPGFRCGTCYDFPVFDVLARKELKLREQPLIAMEVSWIAYKEYSPEKMFAEIKELADRVKKYKGTFTFLWHNSSFNTTSWLKYKPVYSKVLESFISENN